MANQQKYENTFAPEDQNFGKYTTDFNNAQHSNGNVETVHTDAAASKSSEEDNIDSHFRKLFIGGISKETTQKDLKEYFVKFGEVTEVNIKTDPTSGRSRGFAFVGFSSKDSVDTVLHHGPHNIKGKQIEAKRAKLRPGSKKIFVGGIESEVTETDIRNYFEHFGKVDSIELPFDKLKNQRRQFCFVTFEDEQTVDQVCKAPKQKIGNKECDVKRATTKPDQRMGRGGSLMNRGGRAGWDFGMSYAGNYGGYGGYGDYPGYGGYGPGYGYGGYGSAGYNGWGSGGGGYGQNGYSGYGK